MRIRSVLTLLLLFPLAATPAPAAEPSGGSEANAVEVAERLMEALGGREAWEGTRYLTFDFFGRRQHVWDRHTGRHRVSGETQEGETFIVLHDVDDRGKAEGKVYLDGEEATGERRAEMLEGAYAMWINDTYWLIMPYKLQDPGVTLTYAGEETLNGSTYDKVMLSFSGVGLTPGDRYWAWIHRDTGLMDRWAYHLESMEPDAPPVAWEWLGWKRYGDVMLAPTRKQVGGEERQVSLGPIEAPRTVPDATFTRP